MCMDNDIGRTMNAWMFLSTPPQSTYASPNWLCHIIMDRKTQCGSVAGFPSPTTPANEAKVLWKQCGPLTEKDALCSAAEFQSEWISGAEVAYLITACCLGWILTMVSVKIPSLSAYVLINSVKSCSKAVCYTTKDHEIDFYHFNIFLDVHL